jgi:excisionase family DNA binding protein
MSIASCGLSRDNLPARALYSPREAERILSISHATIYRLISAGKLDARKLGGKTVITAASIERLITELPKAPVRPA